VFEPGPQSRIRVQDISDDRATTFVVVEAGEAVEWTRPADLSYEVGKPLPRLGGVSADGFHACFCNNAVLFLKKEIYSNDKLLRALIGRNDGELINLRPYEELPARPPPPLGNSATPPKTMSAESKEVADKVAAGREASRKIVSKNNLKQLGRALREYDAQYGGLPPPAIYAADGRPLLSWRVAVLPFLGQQAVYRKFKLEEPWDSPTNRELLAFMPKAFEAPDANGGHGSTEEGRQGLTYYQIFVGPGVFEPSSRRRPLAASVVDGLSNTIAIAEAAVPVPWTKPDDLPFAIDKPLPHLGGVCRDGFNAAMFDSSVEFFKKEIYSDEKALRALIGWSDGDVVNLRPYLEPRFPTPSKDSPVAAAYEAARRMYSMNSLKQLALAVRSYHLQHGRVPPWALHDAQGRLLLSWRVALLPFLEQKNLYRKFRLDEPWDSEHNKTLLPLMPRVFDSTEQLSDESKTFYQVFVGPGAAFEMDPRHKIRFVDIRDGISNTLLIVEAGAAVPWTKPEDLFFTDDNPLPGLGGQFANGFHACFFDCHVRFLSNKLYADEPTLRALIGIRDGVKVDQDLLR
jgi:hypothetical protein